MEPKIKAVLVGCGSISEAWLKGAQGIPGLEMVGLVDLMEAAAVKRRDEFGLSRAMVGCDLSAVLGAARPELVFNCTTPEAHLETTLEAFRHGCHVLSEKPMADSMENARLLVEAAQSSGKLFAVTQTRRYTEYTRRLRQVIQDGSLGPLTTLNSDFFVGAHFGGFRDQMAHVLLLDMAIHTFDAARYLSGADPLSVYCKEWNPAGSWYADGASVVAIFEMTGDLVYTYRGSWCAEGLRTSWNSSWRIIGQQGSAVWDGEEDLCIERVQKTGGFFSDFVKPPLPECSSPEKMDGHASLIREFVGCVQTGTVPETVCSDNIKSLAMVFAAIQSAETGKTVAIA